MNALMQKINSPKFAISHCFGQSLALTLPWCFIPILFYLCNNVYPWLRPETLIIYATFILLGFLFAYLRSQSFVRKQYIFDAGLVTIVASFLPIYTGLWDMLCIFFCSAVIFMFLRKKTWLFLSWIGIAFVIGQLLVPKFIDRIDAIDTEEHEIGSSLNPKTKNLPVVIHLILDEHAGIADLNTTDPKHELGTKLAQFYQRYGFNVYPNAYSRYSHSINSIPNLLNFTESNIHGGYLQGKEFNTLNGGELKVNRYFELLQQQGYRIRVYQPAFLRYCQSAVPIDRCITYSSWMARVIAGSSIPAYKKSIYIAVGLLDSSIFIKWFKQIYFSFLRPQLLHLGYDPSWIRVVPRLNTVPALQVMDHLENTVIREHAGMVYFVHLLWPHSPYIYTENCTLKNSVTDWQVFLDSYPELNTQAVWRERQNSYHEQIGCVQHRLTQFFERLKQHGVYERAIIIVQGDHGSRIAFHPMDISGKDTILPRDYLYAFATFFAYKGPQTLTTDKKAFVPITTLFTDLVSHWLNVKLPTPSEKNYVYLAPEYTGNPLAPVPAVQALWLSGSDGNNA